MTKIVYVISTINAGGAEIQLIRSLQKLNYAKYEVTLLVLSNNQQLINEVPRKVKIVTHNIRKSPIYFLLDFFGFLFRLLKISPDIVHSSLLLSNLLVRPIKILKPKVKIINHIHGQGNWIPPIIRFFDTYSAFLVNQFLFVSKFSANLRIKRERYPIDKVRVLYNAVETGHLLKVKVRENRTRLYIGTLSRLTSVKCLDKAIDIIIYLNKSGLDSKLIIAGDGSEEEYLKQYCVNSKANEVVDFVGFQSNIPEFLSSIDVLISVSEREDLPINLIEGLISGKPLIATNVGGVSEIITPEVDGLLISPDVSNSDMSNIMKYLSKVNLLEAEQVNKKLGVVKFDIQNYMNNLDEIYQE